MAVEGRLRLSLVARSPRSTWGFSRAYGPAGPLAFTDSRNEPVRGVSLPLFQLRWKLARRASRASLSAGGNQFWRPASNHASQLSSDSPYCCSSGSLGSRGGYQGRRVMRHQPCGWRLGSRQPPSAPPLQSAKPSLRLRDPDERICIRNPPILAAVLAACVPVACATT